MEYKGSYRYWTNQLFIYCLDMFAWEGLPPSIPANELEKILIKNGVGAVYQSQYKDTNQNQFLDVSNSSSNWWADIAGVSGVTPYEYYPNCCTVANPALARRGKLQMKDECVVVFNNSLHSGLMGFISRYADLLANAELTANIALINARMTDMFFTDSQNIVDSINEYTRAIRSGKTKVILSKNPDVKEAFTLRNDLQYIARDKTSDAMLEAWEMRDKILRSFFQSIGRRFAKEKRERMTAEEVLLDDDLLLVNIDDMLDRRLDFCERFNKLSGLNVTVKYKGKMIQEDEEETDEENSEKDVLVSEMLTDSAD